MRILITIMLPFLIYCAGFGQNIIIKNKCKRPIETQGDVLIDLDKAGTIVLKNQTIKCNLLTFGDNITTIKIVGNVSIECNQVAFESAGTAPIALQARNLRFTSSSLSINCATGKFSNVRGFQIKNQSRLYVNMPIRLMESPF